MTACRAAKAERRAYALGLIPSLAEDGIQERPTVREIQNGHFPSGTWEFDPARSRLARLQSHLPVRLGSFGIRAAISLSEEAMFADYLRTVAGVDFLDPWFSKSLEQPPEAVRREMPSLPICVAAPPVHLFQARLRQLAMEELQAVRRLARDDATLARFTSLEGLRAGAWVSVVPAHADFTFTAAKWSIAAAVRLGLPI
ncbi:unnamed protein product [Closterium sp. NIES-53]